MLLQLAHLDDGEISYETEKARRVPRITYTKVQFRRKIPNLKII